MTQSGQGEEPSARPAHEGIVLPSDGGEPLLPGMLNQSGGPAPVPPGGGAIPPAAPPGAQSWEQPWGPDRPGAPPADQPWGTPPPAEGRPWGDAQSDAGAWSGPHPGPLPPEGAQTYGGQGYDGSPAGYGDAGPGAYQDGASGYGASPAYDPGPGYPAQSQSQPQSPSHGGALPSVQDQATRYLPPVPGAGAGALPPGDDGATQFIPPVPAGDSAATQFIPPVPAGDSAATQFIPPVPAGDSAATQFIPPVPAGDSAATQFIPPVPSVPAAPGGDAAATQYLPPVGPGALPPEVPPGAAQAQPSAETTAYLGTGPRQQQPQPQQPHQQPQGAGHPDAEATQFIPPVTGGAGPAGPPAEFAGLFRDEPAPATQQLPRIDAQPGRPAPAGPYDGGGGRRRAAGRGDDGGRRSGRSGSKVPMLAAVGVGIVVVGVGAGALMGGGGGGADPAPRTVSATAPETGAESAAPSPSADPVRAQAEELDKLLADSGTSRTTVINAVADVKQCKDLGKAARDLRDAAAQRTSLVTRLSGISVDQLPEHAALTTALTKAWQASASADDHYAAWADQVAGDKKSCRKGGQARSTGQTQAGNRASGTATAEKEKAAALWNAVAKQYGLTERTPTQL
ncbi:hypothetical protein AB0D49_12565 [Streptomyces sp. NPDC048290]|uniref:hypothetical protein n=1 Tax=Streptomyces sp. NPDC048290 TaxID=3155811 RepID=UPI00342A284A